MSASWSNSLDEFDPGCGSFFSFDFVFFFDRKGNDFSVVFGEFAFDLNYERFVTVDRTEELRIDHSRLVHGDHAITARRHTRPAFSCKRTKESERSERTIARLSAATP